MKSRGVVYSATTCSVYLEAALISALALRKSEPEIDITVISDQSLLKLFPLDDYQISARFIEENNDSSFFSRSIKTQLNHFSPYEETLFLDADILPLQPISSLWDYLSQGDIAMVLDRLPTVSLCDHVSIEEKSYTLRQLQADTKHFNSGVMLWRNSPVTENLFSQWYQEWQMFGKQDQLALVRAIHTTAISVTELPRSYNVSPIDSVDLIEQKQTVHLLHCWGGMVSKGEFRKIAHSYYPDIVETVLKVLGNSYRELLPQI